jgi:hypothetical protein
MAEYAAAFESIDAESAALILQLQHDDLEKLRHGDPSDTQLALSIMREDLDNMQQFVSDRRMTESMASAVQKDADTIRAIFDEENTEEDDGESVDGLDDVAAVNLSEDLNEKILAKLAGQYVSKATGEELLDKSGLSTREPQRRDAQPRSSTAGPGRVARSNKTTMLRCVACSETKNHFDVLEVACGHGYCKICPQELVGLATKDRTYCAWPQCSSFIRPENIDGGVARCGKCGTTTCAICKDQAHDGDCPQDPAIQQTRDLAIQEGWQTCYNCHSVVELDSGCYHMT